MVEVFGVIAALLVIAGVVLVFGSGGPYAGENEGKQILAGFACWALAALIIWAFSGMESAPTG
jgi:hypothetical protein